MGGRVAGRFAGCAEKATDCYYSTVLVSPPVPDYIRNPRSGTYLDAVHVFKHKQSLIIASPADCFLVATLFSLAFDVILAKGGYIRKVLSLIKDLDASSKVSLSMISARSCRSAETPCLVLTVALRPYQASLS